jgi:D-amino peptidase
MMQGIDAGPDAVVFLGYHAMAGAQGVLAHTWLENAITQVRLDGTPVGEGGLNAAVAAEHGVPVVLVTGDDRACAEAGGYAPDALTVVVKECVSRYAAICLPPARSAALLRAGAEAAMAKAGRHAPRPDGHRIEIDFDAAHLADAAAVVPTVTQPGPCTVAVDADSMTAAYRAFKVVATVAASAMQDVYG